MEAATGQRPIDSDKAQRIVDAMRASVARRGVAASTFDHVAREANVSRGLLHYYFGTKERLLAEVVRRDTAVRMAMLDEVLAGARTADDFVGLLAASLRRTVREDPDFITLVFELFTLARRHPDVAAELAEMLRRMRSHIAGVLAAKQAEGVLHLRARPAAIADILLSLSDGISLRMVTDPGFDAEAATEAGTLAVRALLDDR
jgi:AcrR family transcriptional regulator